ncbi:hypothetical protein MA16_Dca021102 [Dendrobium catenatum]|uniref:Uncharacterized protein n=1 Tax=Dendrobium catenatum TaxID=906689 RepID=A0A2I0VXZ1_9ASPA|nr:hypothetical protein MA16_Dca021102 [Dendrobium catenatum]
MRCNSTAEYHFLKEPMVASKDKGDLPLRAQRIHCNNGKLALQSSPQRRFRLEKYSLPIIVVLLLVESPSPSENAASFEAFSSS